MSAVSAYAIDEKRDRAVNPSDLVFPLRIKLDEREPGFAAVASALADALPFMQREGIL